MRWWSFKPYISVAQRKAKAQREMAKLAKNGHAAAPVVLDGKKIASTFWGKAWCDNLESYSDFENRLPRGRTYVRNGSVCDLGIQPGKVTAMVCGSELYKISITISAMAADEWADLKRRCAGRIASLVELLQGKLSSGVMELVTQRNGGLFPRPREMKFSCSCPDYASMCKHVAAALYGVGARLDEQPELLFRLRQVDHLELIDQAGAATPDALSPAARGGKTLAASELAGVFGIELETSPAAGPPVEKQPRNESGKNKSSAPASSRASKPDRARQRNVEPAQKNGAPESPALRLPARRPQTSKSHPPEPPVKPVARAVQALAAMARPTPRPRRKAPATGKKRAGSAE